ncbi:hypothetical protein RQP46_001989 [Phenoliferia psychrophenolica]
MRGLPPSRPSSLSAGLPGFYSPLVKKSARSPLGRWLALGCVFAFCLLQLRPLGILRVAKRGVEGLQGLTCEERGLVSRQAGGEASRVAIVVRPSSVDGSVPSPVNTLLDTPFHPSLTSQHPFFFPGSINPTDSNTSSFAHHPSAGSTSSCIKPVSHVLAMPPPPTNAGKDIEIFYSMCTSPSRAVAFAPVWNHFLSAPSATKGAPGCVVVDAQGHGDLEGRARANAALKASGTSCVMKESGMAGHRYEMRVLGLINDAWIESERRRWQNFGPVPEWFIIADDDTFWIDITDLKDILSQYDSNEDHMLGGFSEAVDNFNHHGRQVSILQPFEFLIRTCGEKFESTIVGGDGLLTHCVALARRMDYQEVVEELPGLSQMDMQGDAYGFLSSGERLLSLHHWAGWVNLLPDTTGVDAVALFADGADAIGGRNMFRRWVFDGGKTVWTAGFSVMINRDALTEMDLERVEQTWGGFHPRREPRPDRIEGAGKLTYWIKSVERLSPTLTLFRHECDHPSVQNGLRQIDILWDTQGETSWWDMSRRVRYAKAPVVVRPTPTPKKVEPTPEKPVPLPAKIMVADEAAPPPPSLPAFGAMAKVVKTNPAAKAGQHAKVFKMKEAPPKVAVSEEDAAKELAREAAAKYEAGSV